MRAFFFLYFCLLLLCGGDDAARLSQLSLAAEFQRLEVGNQSIYMNFYVAKLSKCATSG